MSSQHTIIIVGGGTAGWMTAAALSCHLSSQQYRITLIESSQIGTVGVGEATIPHIRQFNQMVGIDENEFIRATGATYKLAIQFEGWGQPDSHYMHPFGVSGEPLNQVDFHHYWLRLFEQGRAEPFEQYSLSVEAARQYKFAYPQQDPASPLSEYSYAFHLDATAYAALLKKKACEQGVELIDARILACQPDGQGGISRVRLDDGRQLQANWFIDCSGFRTLLAGDSLNNPFEDWSHWLPCDSAWATASGAINKPPPYTRSIAHQAGWQWQIPLQQRTGNGLVFASQYWPPEQAREVLMDQLPSAAMGEPRLLQFRTGKRRNSWVGNCVAIGLSAGFLEPLESTSLYLVQAALQRLLYYFPQQPDCHAQRQQFNQEMNQQYLRIRDFLILHYKLNKRSEPFWQDCASMSVPDSVTDAINWFEQQGRVASYRHGLFMPASWLAVMLGQGLIPQRFDQRAGLIDEQQLDHYMQGYRQRLQQLVKGMPSHQQAIQASRIAVEGHYPPAVASLYGRGQ